MEKIKETIKYYIVLLYYNTIYKHYMYKVDLLIDDINNSSTKEIAIEVASKKRYNHIPQSYKEKLINEKYS